MTIAKSIERPRQGATEAVNLLEVYSPVLGLRCYFWGATNLRLPILVVPRDPEKTGWSMTQRARLVPPKIGPDVSPALAVTLRVEFLTFDSFVDLQTCMQSRCPLCPIKSCGPGSLS
jgi:hypothetical protein